ncbi:MAG: DNA-processing protein DprA [Deltaproteobacteria bacterium]
MTKGKYYIWLKSIPGIGEKRFLALKEYFGSPEKVWNASKSDLLCIPGLERIAASILSSQYRQKSEEYMNKLNENGIRLISIEDSEYPDILKNIHNPPQIIHIKGNLKLDKLSAIAIVGARRATGYGTDMARQLAKELAFRGITVVSGMARGVDTYAHKGAVEAGGTTIAVMGCGIDVVYPPENYKLIEKVCTSGAVISEYGMGMQPFALNFPARNRIISGLSKGVIVIEAGEKSGSLITADLALEQGREVFAVPGNADSSSSKGTNTLIKQGAKLVTCVEDILEEFEELKNVKIKSKQNEKIKGLNADEIKIIENINGSVHIDMLSRAIGCTVQKTNTTLMMLELKGIVKQLPGNFFVRT